MKSLLLSLIFIISLLGIAKADTIPPFSTDVDSFGYYFDLDHFGDTLRFRWCPGGDTVYRGGDSAEYEWINSKPNPHTDTYWTERFKAGMHRHLYTITKGYYIMERLLLKTEWDKAVASSRVDLSVIGLGVYPRATWFQSFQYALHVNKEIKSQIPDGYEFRFPTDAEWDYANSAGRKDYLLNEITKSTWYPLPPKTDLEPNPWGIWDMNGAAATWVYDAWDQYFYEKEHFTDPMTLTVDRGDPGCYECWGNPARGGVLGFYHGSGDSYRISWLRLPSPYSGTVRMAIGQKPIPSRSIHDTTTIDTTISIEELDANSILENDTKIVTNPNPFNPAVKISLDYVADNRIGEISIFSASGKQVYNSKVTGIELSKGISWQPENLSAGVYMVKITYNKKVFTKKISFIK